MNPIEFYGKNKYLLLDEEMAIEMPDFEALKTYFKGHKKVIYSILFRYFNIPVWRTFVVKELTPLSIFELGKFSTTAKTFFVRSDTFKDKVDNPSRKSCPSNELLQTVQGFLRRTDRFVVIMAQPDYDFQEHVNLANCRTGIINSEVIQEWTGPGFSEYHLGKDKFPHKATIHAYLKKTGKSYSKLHIAEAAKFLEDAQQLYFAIGAEQIGLKDKISVKIKKPEPTNDELEQAYQVHFAKDYSYKSLVKKGHRLHKKINSPLVKHIETGKKWLPSKDQILMADEFLTRLIKKCKKLGIQPEGKVLTMSFNNYSTKHGVCFWDIFNLLN